MKHLLIPALALLVASCSGSRPASSSGPAPAPVAAATEAPAQAPQLGGKGKADTLFLSLERTPCFGTCKAYRIDVYRSGHARYDGRLNVEKEGPHQARIGSDTLMAILHRAEELGFFGMEAKYDAEVTDLPSTVLRIVADGRDKKVLGRVGQPQAFKQLVAEIEALLLPVAWRPIAPEP